jgi:hypothetical protein
MNMATLGLKDRKLGGLVKLAGVALSGAVLLGGSAFAQVELDISVDAPDTYPAEGGTVAFTFTVERTDVNADPDSDVTAVGAEIVLPTGWKLERDIDSTCDATISDNQTVGVNSTIQVKGADNVTPIGAPPNEVCPPIPATGDTLEVFWIPEGGGGDTPLPVAFPLEVSLTVTVPSSTTGTQNIGATVKYRVLEGGEETGTGGDTIDESVVVGCTNPGDGDGNATVDVDDVQAIFDFIIAVRPDIDDDCADFCDDSVVDVSDVQGIFNSIIQLPNPCAG